ncbi:MAG: hypoxanthine phosphoribosyltransferase [Candidatus Electryonea clarkiae]|nr:hypoxanthine phosphoribosyltransferase [Candidatus Electryonea clarkiae]MDP8285703.1 hypoxanthine phosphoribosyltransferase [Candidatus Electryonea clarkiae]
MFTLASNPLISAEAIAERVSELAGYLSTEFVPKGPVTVLAMLRGSYVFAADLLRELSRKGVIIEEIDFIEASSYGADTVSSGTVRINKGFSCDITGKQVLIIDDILDTGNTIRHILGYLADQNPKSITTCFLLDKPSRREHDVEADYVGFKIEDNFVVGYGLDFNQRFRELPYIGIIEERA